MATDGEWRLWVKELGLRTRRLRELVGFSQAQLAEAAGVSQGGVSRFEAGRGLATPLLVAVKLSAVLAEALRKLDVEALSVEARAYLERADYIAVPKFKGIPASIFADPRIDGLLRALGRMPGERRELALVVMLAVAGAIEEPAHDGAAAEPASAQPATLTAR